MTPEEILAKAAELLSERGHCKGELQDPSGRLCMMGALLTAAFGAVRFVHTLHVSPNFTAYQTALLRLGEVTLYNDHPTTTAEDAILTLKRAAHDT